MFMNKQSIITFLVLLISFHVSIISMPIPQQPLPGMSSVPTPLPTPTPQPLAPITPISTPMPTPVAPAPIMPTPSTPTPTPFPLFPAPAPIPSTPAPIPSPLFPAPSPVPAPTATAESYKQELAKVSADIDSINTLKGTLKAQLTDLDNKLAQTQEQLAGIKKLSFEILSKEDEAEATKTLGTMKQSLASIQQMQKAVESTTVQEFNTTAQNIKNLMISVQAQLQSLENKSTALKTVSPATPSPTPTLPSTPPAAAKGISVSTPAIPTAPSTTPETTPLSKIEEKPLVQRSLIHRFFNTIADIITGSITMVASILSSLKEMVIPTQPTLTELERQKELEEAKKKVASQPPTTAAPFGVTPVSVTAPVLPMPQAPIGSPAFANEVKSNIATIEQIVKKLDDQRLSIKQMVGDIKKQSKSLRQRIEQNPELKKEASKKLVFDGERKADVWKKKAESWFTFFLNGIDTIVTSIHDGFFALYGAIMRGISKAWKSSAQEQKSTSATQTATSELEAKK